MMIRALLLSLVALTSLALGVLALNKSKHKSSIKWSFLLICICLATWSVGLEVFLSADNPQTLDTASRWFYAAAAIFCPAVGMFIINSFFGSDKKYRLMVNLMAAASIAAAVYIFTVPEFIIARRLINAAIDVSSIPINHGQYLAFSVFFCAFFVAAVWLGFLAIKHSTGIKRRQVLSCVFGLIVASIPGFIVDLLLPSFGNYTYVWIGPVAVISFLFAIMYSIVRYRMMDIKSAISRSVSYVLLIIALASIYFVLAYVTSVVLFGNRSLMDSGVDILNIFLALLLAFLFQPIKRFFDSLTDKIFYYDEPNPETFSREIGKILTQTTDLQLLTKRVSHYLARSLKSEKVTFCIPEKGIYGKSGRRRRSVIEDDVRKIMKYYSKHHEFPEVIITEHVKDPELKNLLKIHNTKIILPLTQQHQEIGILFLGDHKSLGYSSRSVRMLESIAGELAVSIQNALSMEEVRDLNETLQRKIDEATRELRLTNRQLQRLDEAKNEFISMASHQLRTPLTSIKGYLDMLLEGDLGRVPPTQRAVLKEAFSSSERMVRLINDFLNISRLQTGKFIIDKRKSNIAQIVKEEVALLSVVAEQRSIKLNLKITKRVPEIKVDAEKIRQVILNMIDNAIYYSKPGSKVEVSLAKVDGFVEFIVKDSGIGVPKSEQANLFSKFFRASNARKRRPDGTGVGLFLARKVVLSHGGEMIFSSEEGEGSIFGFRIPV